MICLQMDPTSAAFLGKIKGDGINNGHSFVHGVTQHHHG